MEKILIDTNVFWEVLCEIAGISLSGRRFDVEKIKGSNCFISEITKIEIMSVLGKYARGEQAQWQPCNRIIGENGEKCTEKFFNPGRKRWKNKQVAEMRKLIKDILEGNSNILYVHVLSVTDAVIVEAERFIRYALQYKFASLDAMIAGTVMCYDKENFIVATHDGSLRRALLDEGVHIMDEYQV